MTRVEVHDPLKEGLKRFTGYPFGTGLWVEVHDPLKEGLKPITLTANPL